jgi:hypothetical protein
MGRTREPHLASQSGFEPEQFASRRHGRTEDNASCWTWRIIGSITDQCSVLKFSQRYLWRAVFRGMSSGSFTDVSELHTAYKTRLTRLQNPYVQQCGLQHCFWMFPCSAVSLSFFRSLSGSISIERSGWRSGKCIDLLSGDILFESKADILTAISEPSA